MAGRGRYARNAVVQGAAAEFFKVWAATVRARAWSHPGVVPIYAIGALSDGRPFYVMPLIAGESLREAIAYAESLPGIQTVAFSSTVFGTTAPSKGPDA